MTQIEDDRRQGSYPGMPTKYSALPRISNSFDLSSGEANNRLVPYTEPMMQGADGHDERLRLLETRLVVTEKSNRALLDEVVRLQNELMVVTRKSEEAIREERQARKYIENSVRTSQGFVSDLSNRLKAAEDNLSDERHQLGELLGQARSVEQQVLSNTQESSMIRDRYVGKVSSLEKEIEEMSRDRQKMERISFQLVDEMRTLKTKLESQGYDFTSITSDMRNKSKRMEDDYQHNLDNMRKQLERNADGEQGGQHLRQVLDQRLVELRDMTVHLRTRMDEEMAERRSLEQMVNQRMAEFNRNLSEQSRLREENMHNVLAMQKEKEHRMDTERLALQNRLAESVEETNSKLLDKELKLREEQIKRHTDLEKVIRSEQEARQDYEREMRSESERKWDNVKRLQTEEIAGVKDQQRHDRDRFQESARKLDDAVGLLEKQIDESKRDISKVLSAEIKTRTKKDTEYKGRLDQLEEKISAATAALQQAIGGIANNMGQHSEKVRRMMAEMLEDYRREVTRQLGDLDARILGIQNRVANIDEQVDTKVASATADIHASVRDKMESVSLWQASTTANIVELRHQKEALQDELYRAQESLTLLKSELQSRVGAEIDGRIQDVDAVRRELEVVKSLMPRDPMPTKKEMDQLPPELPDNLATQIDIEMCQASIRKLAESMQTVKTVLGMKIQSEQKLRLEEVKNLQDEIIRIRALIEPLIHLKLQPRLFVKPDEEDGVNRDVAEMASPAINQWSIYNAYRMMTFKSKWMYVKWSLTERRKERENMSEISIASKITADLPNNEDNEPQTNKSVYEESDPQTNRSIEKEEPENKHPWDEEKEAEDKAEKSSR